MGMKNPKTKKVIAGIIAGLLILSMIVPMALEYLR